MEIRTQDDERHAGAVPRWVGSSLVLASAVMFSCSGVLTKAIDAGSWTVLTWRGLIGALGIAAYVWSRNRARPVRDTFRLGTGGWVLAAVGGVGSVTFIVAFKHTYVANVSVIYATIPFVAALLERAVLSEPIQRRTLATATTSLIGVVVIVSGSLGSPNLDGDAVAIAMVALNALYMVLIRTFTDTDAPLAAAASSLLLFGAGWFAATPLDVTRRDAVLLVVFGLVFAVATVLWTEGTKLIPAAESGLLGSAETPVAIAMAWGFLSEAPPVTSGVGAAVVLTAIIAHARADFRRDAASGQRLG
ncbi:MAG: EamA family transporter [Ilumatobacter sp.]|uniref:DMT family transporter n=1 Tax=Ilumatobacter sp. TaxID=1967498 RepID=UPI002635E57C|nr:EamA family transporter [Ilumatobacter sp.]MDJ0771715.1 EamA family transporter [Ilumatobacter sp.]